MVAPLLLFADPSASLGAAERLLEWSSAGWVRPFLLIGDPRRDEREEGTRFVQAGQLTDVAFDKYITGEEIEEFRLLLIQLVPGGDEGPNAAGRQLARWVAEELEHRKAPHQSVRRISLVVPAAGCEPLPSDVVMRHWAGNIWDANIIAFPEDRPGPSSAYRAVKGSAGFNEHSALHIVSVGGLWSGCFGGPTMTTLLSPRNETGLMASRVFTRMVRGPLLVDNVLAQALPLSERPRDPRQIAALLGGRPARLPHRIIDESSAAASRLAGDGALQCHIETPIEAGGVRDKHGLSALAEWLTYMTTGVPRKVRERVRRRLSGVKQRASLWITQRYADDPTESDTVVSVGGELHPSLIPITAAAESHPDNEPAVAREPSEVAYIHRALWRDLRQVAFGLLDGGALPEFVATPTVGTEKEIIVDPGLIAPHPIAGTATIGSFFGSHVPDGADPNDRMPVVDPARYSAWLEWLDAAAAGAGGQQQEDTEPTATSGANSTSGASPVSNAPTEAPPAPLASLNHLMAVRDRLSEFVAAASQSFIWKVMARLDDTRRVEIRSAEEKVRRKELSAAKKREDFEEEGRKDHRLGKWGRRLRFLSKLAVVFAAFLPVVFYAIAKSGTERWLSVLTALLTGKALGAAFLVGGGIAVPVLQFGSISVITAWFVELLREIAKDFKVEHARRTWEVEEKVAQAMRRELEREKVRLDSIYGRITDWGELLAWMVHRPFGAAQAGMDELPGDSPTSPGHPLALRSSEGVVTSARLSELAGRVCREALGPGWLGTAFDAFASQWLRSREWASLEGGRTASDLLDESLDGVNLREMSRSIEEGLLGTVWLTELRELVLRRLAELGPDDLFERIREEEGSSVVTFSSSAGDLTITPGAFLTGLASDDASESASRKPFIGGDDAAGIWTTGAYNSGASEIASTTVWLPSPLGLPARPESQVVPALPVIAPDGSCIFTSVRLDLTKALPASSYALFAAPQQDFEERGASRMPDAGPMPG